MARASAPRRLLALCVLLVVFGSCRKPTNGREYYEALNCRSCHRIGEEGTTSGPDLTYVGFRKTPQWLDFWLRDPQAWNKAALMPNPRLTDRSRRMLVDYLSALRGQAFAGRKPWAGIQDPIERGRVIFGRAGCIACHGKGGQGGYPNNNVPGGLIPSLASVSQTYKREELIAKIKRGSRPQKADPSGPDPMISMPAWGQILSGSEIEDVAAYLLALKNADKAADF